MALHSTRNDIPAKQRTRLCDLLNARLADAIDLAAQAKQAHWNVKGPQFIALHGLFDALHTAVAAQVDELAERITALGGTADGTVASVAKRSSLPGWPRDTVRGAECLAAVAAALAAHGAQLRKAIRTAAKADDDVTADLFTGMAAEIDKQLWLVEAHLQTDG